MTARDARGANSTFKPLGLLRFTSNRKWELKEAGAAIV